MRGQYNTEPIPTAELAHLVELSKPPQLEVQRFIGAILVTCFITCGACLMVAMLLS